MLPPRTRIPIAAAALLLSATLARADSDIADRVDPPSGVAVAADFLLARPLGLVATVAGTGVFLAALPFAALARNVSTPARLLVGEPARFTFVRPLGESSSGDTILGP